MLTSNHGYHLSHMEIELKLSLDPAHAARLRSHPLLAGVKPTTRRLHSVYLDTPAWDLMRRGIALRVRRAGRKWVQTLKVAAASVGALSRRPEWEVDLPRGHHDFALLPPDARALLDGLRREGVDLELVGPAFATDFRRTAWQVAMGEAVMELALDLGEIRAAGAVLPLSEVEIELKSGPGEALFDLALGLLETLPLGVEPRSKAARGYALAGAVALAPVKAGPPRLARDMDAGLAWNGLAEAALAQAVGNVPGFLARPEEIEYLHQLRVGLRRLHVVAALAGSLDRPAPPWDGELKRAMASLNAARDWDVLLGETLPRLAPTLDQPPPSRAFGLHLRRRAEAARRAAQAAVAGPAFTRLVLEVGRDLLQPRAAGRPVRPWAGECMGARWRVMKQRGKGLARLDAAGRHRLRIVAKRLRYTADALAPVFGDDGEFLSRLGRLQDVLGAAQDQVVAMGLMAKLDSASPAVKFDAGRVAGLLAGEVARGAKGRTRGGARAWRRLRRARLFWKG